MQLWAEAGVCSSIRYIVTMNLRRCFILGLLAAVWFSGQTLLALDEAPYAPIVTRNVFGLVPIPTNNPADAAPPAPPPPKITPNGIMTLFGKLQVLFKVAGVAKPGQPAKEESYVMSEGDRQDEIEVQRIDGKAGIIRFNNHGVVQELALVAGAASGGGAAPAAPGFIPSPVMPSPRVMPAAGGSPPIDFGGRFGRNRNNPPDNSSGVGSPSSASANSLQNQQQLTPEAQIIMIEAQRMDFLQKGDSTAKILPPTELTPLVNDASGGGAAMPEQQ